MNLSPGAGYRKHVWDATEAPSCGRTCTAECSTLAVDANTLAVKIGAPKQEALFGGMGEGVLGDATCPAGHVAIGLLGFLYTSDSTLIGLGLHCAKPVVEF